MKKVLVLMFVLGLAALVNAVPEPLQLSVNHQPAPDEITLMPSDVIVIDITDNNPGIWLRYIDIYNLSEGRFQVEPVQWGQAAGDSDLKSISEWYDARQYGIDALEAEISQAWNPDTLKGGNAIPGTVVQFLFHCTGLGDVTIELVNLSSGEVLDKLIIHQVVPEPMTMALLGLGGLFLRRR